MLCIYRTDADRERLIGHVANRRDASGTLGKNLRPTFPTVGGRENAWGADGIEDQTCRICCRRGIFDGGVEPRSLPRQPIYGVIPFVLVVGRIVDGAEDQAVLHTRHADGVVGLTPRNAHPVSALGLIENSAVA